MKPALPALAVLLFAATIEAAPADHIGRLLPRLELYGGTVHRNATIVAADEQGITVRVADVETKISRYLLQPAARVALDYPAEPHIVPRKAVFAVVQIVGGGCVARRWTAPAAGGSMQSLTDQIFRAGAAAPARPAAPAIFLDGPVDPTVADGDLLSVSYVDVEGTKKLEDALTGATRTLRSLLVLSAGKFR